MYRNQPVKVSENYKSQMNQWYLLSSTPNPIFINTGLQIENLANTKWEKSFNLRGRSCEDRQIKNKTWNMLRKLFQHRGHMISASLSDKIEERVRERSQKDFVIESRREMLFCNQTSVGKHFVTIFAQGDYEVSFYMEMSQERGFVLENDCVICHVMIDTCEWMLHGRTCWRYDVKLPFILNSCFYILRFCN